MTAWRFGVLTGMNRRKSLLPVSMYCGRAALADDRCGLPPFSEADVPVSVGVHLVEKSIELAVRDCESRAPQSVP
jgi:hypothetical protein